MPALAATNNPAFDRMVDWWLNNVPGADLGPNWGNRFNDWAFTQVAQQGAGGFEDIDFTKLSTQAGAPGAGNAIASGADYTEADLPFEQAFGDQVISDYILPDLAADADRRKIASDILTRYQPGFDATRTLIGDINDGDLLAAERAASDAAAAEQQRALDAQIAANSSSLTAELAAKQTALQQELSTLGGAVDELSVARKAALGSEMQKLVEAQNEVNAARIRAAESQASQINLGAEATVDRLTADAARRGYVGGSTGDSNALARSIIGARQQAAATRTAADLTNSQDNMRLSAYGAGENRSITDDIAGKRYDIAGYGAGQGRQLSNYGADQTRANADFGSSETRNIADANAQRKLGFFSNDVTRRLAALSLPAQAVQQEFQVRDMADNYGQSGLRRSMENLNFFNIGTSQAPNTNPYYVQPNTTTGDTMQNLGAGLVNLGGSIGNANNWWSKPTTSFAKKNPTGTTMSYDQFVNSGGLGPGNGHD